MGRTVSYDMSGDIVAIDGETFDSDFGAPETPKMSAEGAEIEMSSIEALCNKLETYREELETYRKELAHYKNENEQLLNCIRRLAAIIGEMTK